MNYFMDLIKFALVIGLPDDDTFGYLIIASFAFVVLGAAFYVAFAFNPGRVRAAAEASGVLGTTDRRRQVPVSTVEGGGEENESYHHAEKKSQDGDDKY